MVGYYSTSAGRLAIISVVVPLLAIVLYYCMERDWYANTFISSFCLLSTPGSRGFEASHVDDLHLVAHVCKENHASGVYASRYNHCIGDSVLCTAGHMLLAFFILRFGN